MHISFPFSFHSELLANHPASILKAEIKFVCVCMLYGKDTKYLKMITQKKSMSSVVSQNMNSIKIVLVAEMLLLAVCVNSGFRK